MNCMMEKLAAIHPVTTGLPPKRFTYSGINGKTIPNPSKSMTTVVKRIISGDRFMKPAGWVWAKCTSIHSGRCEGFVFAVRAAVVLHGDKLEEDAGQDYQEGNDERVSWSRGVHQG